MMTIRCCSASCLNAWAETNPASVEAASASKRRTSAFVAAPIEYADCTSFNLAFTRSSDFSVTATCPKDSAPRNPSPTAPSPGSIVRKKL